MNDTTADHPTPTGLRRRLVRSRRERMIAGVAGGIAEAYGVDPVLVRLAFVAATLLGGAGLVLYVAAWVLVPEAPEGPEGPGPSGWERPSIGAGRPAADDVWLLVSLVLVVLGGLLTAGMMGWHRGPDVVWPLILVGTGAAILWLRAGDRLPAGPPPSPTRTAAPDEPPGPGATPPAAPGSPPVTPVTAGAGAATTTTTAWPPPATWPTAPSAPRPARRRPAPFLGPLTVSVLFIGAGALWLLRSTGVASVEPGVVVGAALIVVGAALVVGTWFGRGRGLIALGLVLAPVAGTFAFLDVPLRGGIGDREVRPQALSALAGRYELAMGSLTVDLRGVDFSRADGVTPIRAQVAMGEVIVVVPEGVEVDVRGRADAGEVVLFGRGDEGVDVDSSALARGREGGGRLDLDLRVGFGSAEVRRAESLVEGSRT